MKKLNTRGFTLIELMVVIVVMAFLTSATLSFADFVRNDIAKQENIALENTEQGMFFGLLSQPTYVGALAQYAENASLKACLNADGNLCQIKKDYPLKAFDLETGTELNNMDSSSVSFIKSEFSFQIHCRLNTIECDQAEYLSVKIKSTIVSKQGLGFSSEKIVVVQPIVSNVITMVPNSKLEPGTPVNIVILLDGSNSMSGIQASFKLTLAKLVTSLQNLDATISVYPLHENSWAKHGQSYVIDGTGNKKYLSWADESLMGAGESRFVDVEWIPTAGNLFNTSWASASSDMYRFKSDFTSAQREAVVTGLNNRIDKIFTDMASSTDRDSAMCDMLRLLDNATAGKNPLGLDSKTPTVFMVITNEDDESVLLKPGATFIGLPAPYTLDFNYICAKGVVQKWTRDSGKVWYYGDKFTYKVTGSQTTLIDGAPYTKTFTNATLDKIKYRPSHVVGADCLADANGIDKVEVTKALGYYAYIKGSSPYTLTSCTVEFKKASTIGVAPEGTHPCVGLEANPSSHPYYVPGTCTEKEVPATQMGWQGSGASVLGYYVPTDTEAHATGSLPTAIHNIIQSKFNVSNTLFSFVINPTSGVCPATPGSFTGVKYEELAGKFSANSQIIPICSSDYSGKILDLTKKLDVLGMNDFTMPVGTGDRLSGVDIVRSSTIIPATEGADFVRNGDILIFTNGFLKSTDIVRFYLK